MLLPEIVFILSLFSHVASDPENILDSGKLTQAEEDKISEIRNQVLFLQVCTRIKKYTHLHST